MARNPRHGRRRGSARERYPLLSAYGDAAVRFLGHEEAVAATRDQRIRSVWPFLVKAVLEFCDSLTPRARANYDPEDVMGELYAVLLEKDARWEPDRGKYLSFVGRLISNELHAIRDRATTVHSPRNSASRIKGYEAAGEMSARRRKTYVDILRVAAEHLCVEDAEPPGGGEAGGAEAAAAREDYRRARARIRLGVAGLDADEAEAIGRAFGLFGRPEQPVPEIAAATGRTAHHVRKVIARAQRKFKRRLEAAGPEQTSN